MLEKLDRRCVVHLSPLEVDSVRIVVSADAAGSVAAFALFKRSEWFEGYRIESQNANQIGLEMDVGNLVRALRSAAAADDVLVKLAKKGVPVLTFDIRTHLGPILQDVPVAVLGAQRLAEYCEPENEYIKGFTLPPLAKLHSVVDRMKGLGTDLELRAVLGEHKADLSLSVNTDNVAVSTTYKDLALASYDTAPEDPLLAPEPAVAETTVGATVDLRNFSRSLYGHQVQPRHAICFIHANCVMVHLMGTWDVGLTYYIPRRVSPT